MDKDKIKRQEIFEAAISYKDAGLEVIPNHPDHKYPLGIKDWQIKVFNTEELKHYILDKGWNIGIKNIEGLDFDNNGDPNAEHLLADWKALVDTSYAGLMERLLIERTLNGGFHVPWKCKYIEENQKLAVAGDKTTLIETRGKGGQFVVAPSRGYEIVQGSWDKLPIVTKEEREVLIECARALTQEPGSKVVNNTNDSSHADERPGDVYNANASNEEVLNLLTGAGWKEIYSKGGVIFLRRPGKRVGVSATLGHIAPGVFYNFSSNADPFEINKAYLPFVVFAYLKHEKNFSSAAKEVLEKSNQQEGYESKKEISKLINILTIDDLLQMPEEKELEWLVDKFILKQSITTVSGLPNHYKSWLVQHMCYCVAKGERFLKTFDTHQSSVLIIDREVPPKRAVKRWKLFGDLSGLPLYFYPYDKGFDLKKKNIYTELKEIVERYNIELVVIDTFNRSHGGSDINSAQDVIKVFEPLKRLIGSVSIILVHHSNKKGYSRDIPTGEELLGSTDFMAEIDMLFTLRKRTETSFSVHNIKAKDTELFPDFEVEIITNDKNVVSLEYKGDFIPERSSRQIREEKIIHILNKGEIDKNLLISKLAKEGENEGTVNNTLTILKKKGVIGSKQTGRNALYFIKHSHFTVNASAKGVKQLNNEEKPGNKDKNTSRQSELGWYTDLAQGKAKVIDSKFQEIYE